MKKSKPKEDEDSKFLKESCELTIRVSKEFTDKIIPLTTNMVTSNRGNNEVVVINAIIISLHAVAYGLYASIPKTMDPEFAAFAKQAYKETLERCLERLTRGDHETV